MARSEFIMSNAIPQRRLDEIKSWLTNRVSVDDALRRMQDIDRPSARRLGKVHADARVELAEPECSLRHRADRRAQRSEFASAMPVILVRPVRRDHNLFSR